MKILKCLLMIVTAPVILVLTLFVWLCMGLIYISGLVLGLLSTVIALLGVAVLITYSPQNGAILLIMAFLIGCFVCACGKEDSVAGESLVEDTEEVSSTEETKNTEEEAAVQ